MPKTRTMFVPMFEDFAPELSDDENRWFDTDHVPQRLSIPGFVGAERFERADLVPLGGIKHSPLRYLNIYWVESPEVLLSEAYRTQAAHRTPRASARTAARGGLRLREVWSQRPSPWEGAAVLYPAEGPVVYYVVAQDSDPEHDDEVNHFLDEEQVPRLLGCPGVLNAMRYVREDIALPGVPGAPSPRYLSFFQIASPQVVTADQFGSHIEFESEWAGRLGDALVSNWHGVYAQRPSPWTVKPYPRE